LRLYGAAVPDTPERAAGRLAAESLAAGDPTGWFEPLYAGGTGVPWDRGVPHPLLAGWAHDLDGAGRSALVIGAGLGEDAELLAARGFATTAFDISATAIAIARDRHPGSAVDYRVADLLHPPPAWRGAFDLVAEVFTVQALPDDVRPAAIANVASFVATGGTLVVVATAREDGVPPGGPPWPLTRAEVDSFGLEQTSVEQIEGRWRAIARRAPRA
jgi:SAM-dependent methyltransferase